MSSASLKCVARRDVPSSDWDRFVDECDEAWLYHRYDFLDALATWPSRTDTSFAVYDLKTNEIVGVVPSQLLTEPFAKILKRKSIDIHGGVALKDKLSAQNRLELIAFILEQLRDKVKYFSAHKISFFVSALTPAYRRKSSNANPLLEWKCRDTPANSWMVAPQIGPEELWKNMEGRARTAVRKAENAGVTVREANRSGDVDIYYQLHEETYRRTKVVPHQKAYFEQIWKKFRDKGFARIFFAEFQGQAVAAENFSIYKRAAEYWTGASSKLGLSVGANSLLQWTAMKWMTENQVDWYNFGEAFTNLKKGKLKGLNDFKKSFGGELVPLYRGSLLPNLKAKVIEGYLNARRSMWQ